jgi:hypothetical protein
MDDDLALPGETVRTLRYRVWQGVRYFAFLSLFTAAPALLRGDFVVFAVAVAVSAVAGAVGGAMYFVTGPWRARGGATRTFANVITLLAFCAGAIVLLVLVALFIG